jgi:dTDP-glucose 4,6-dehydratase
MSSTARSLRSRSGLDDRELRQLILGNEALFESFKAASLLLTGATGWFGVWLLDVLCTADAVLDLGLRITAVSRNPAAFLDRYPGFSECSRITWVTADVRWFELGGHDFSYIIHAAADNRLSPAPDARSVLFDTLVDGARRVLATVGPRCRGVLFVSSGAVYGPALRSGMPFRETDTGGPDPLSQASTYAEGKRAAEQLGALAVARGVPLRIARCFAFVGPHMPFDQHFAIGNFIADAVAGREILIKSDGRPQRSYLYMTDLVRALLTVLISGTVGSAYNVGSEVSVTLEELARLVDHAVGGRGVRILGAVSDPADRYVPDTTRIRNELGFVPDVALESAITRTATWRRQQMNTTMQH